MLDILIFGEEWDIIVVQNYVWRKIESKLLLWKTTKLFLEESKFTNRIYSNLK